MVDSKRARSRKATWLAFGLVALAAASRAAEYSGAKGQITYAEDATSAVCTSYFPFVPLFSRVILTCIASDNVLYARCICYTRSLGELNRIL